MCDDGEFLEVAERRAILTLQQELDRHAKVTERAFNLIGKVLSSLPKCTNTNLALSERVACSLLVRLSNDLRAASLLALRGYPVQALSLVASMYESAYTLAAIGSDENMAQEWVVHDDPTRSFKNLRDLTCVGLTKLSAPNAEAQAATEYRVYRQLCLAKHLNPLFQRQHGIQHRGNFVVVMNGPDVSEPAVRAGWFALEHAAALSFVALTSFVLNHVPLGDHRKLKEELEEIGSERKKLEALAKARWGSEDPFPGKW